MKILNFILALMFLSFAFVQINDPDPLIWILIYGIMAVTAILAAFNIYSFKYLAGLLVIYALYSLLNIKSAWYWLTHDNKRDIFDEIAKMNNLYIEETREFLGLVICMAVLAFYLVRARKATTPR